jgi:hypothetical protein
MQTLYFPDYDDTLPQIDGFVDASYGNDTCPSLFSEKLYLTVHCDYKDEAKRETAGGTRYGVSDDCGMPVLATDNLDDVLAFIDSSRLLAALELAQYQEK